MRIELLGHACFLVTLRSGTALLVDPFAPGGLGGRLRYEAVPVAPDYVLLSHEHADHADLSWVAGDPEVVRSPLARQEVTIDVWHAAHDELGGNLRGGQVRIFSIRADGAHLVHCGDLGERLTPDRTRDWPPVDALIVPTGGYFTLGAEGAAELTRLVGPHFAVPCHYRTPAVALPQLLPVERFTRYFPPAMVRSRAVLDLDAEPYADDGAIIVLTPRAPIRNSERPPAS